MGCYHCGGLCPYCGNDPGGRKKVEAAERERDDLREVSRILLRERDELRAQRDAGWQDRADRNEARLAAVMAVCDRLDAVIAQVTATGFEEARTGAILAERIRRAVRGGEK